MDSQSDGMKWLQNTAKDTFFTSRGLKGEGRPGRWGKRKILAETGVGVGFGDFLNYTEYLKKMRSLVNVQYSTASSTQSLEFSTHLYASSGTPQTASPANSFPNAPSRESWKLALMLKFCLCPLLWKSLGTKRAHIASRCLKWIQNSIRRSRTFIQFKQ